MNVEFQEEVVEAPATIERLEPRFTVLESEELEGVGGGYCVADY